ncbi:5-oxoprolinase subunit B family protein [Alteromonas sp. a30]|uniref:5-oxoprolinase subunit B family protein n=1 Tax=Alteromonas sp. a30 TaxID=2730917 RepID=UPI00227FBAFA|nr:allophanate hydrolase subunit 1 [Alteromonas sp. a30]MCY7296347.1 allophanate hydrolase subunit 1 [Alteromonas sp. a30]
MTVGFHISLASEEAITLYWQQKVVSPQFIKQVSDTLWQTLVKPVQIKHPEHRRFWDVVPSNNNITVFFNPLYVSSVEAKQIINNTLKGFDSEIIDESNLGHKHSIPVFYGGESALDLASVAEQTGLSVDEVIALHCQACYEVAAVGFAPGFAYLNGLPERLRVPRMAKPRKHIVAGSLAIAEQQTAIYPCDSPAGWHVIGHCPLPLFSLETGAKLAMGDRVTFTPVSLNEYQALLEQQSHQ